MIRDGATHQRSGVNAAPRRSSAHHQPPADAPAIARLCILALGLALQCAPLLAATEPGLLCWWSFGPDRRQGSVIKAWRGGPDITPSGPVQFIADPPPGRIELPARGERLLVAESVTKALLPKTSLTLESWVRVDRTQEWGGIFSAIQDNGEFERGLLLGFRTDRFALGVATEKAGRLTYLSADQPFEKGRWHHVVGTYDGTWQRLYVNGRLAAATNEQSGPVWYATSGPVVIGAYQDQDENYPTQGAIQEIRLWQRALDAKEIAERYASRRAEFPAPAPEPIRLEPSFGPFVDWVDRATARVSWETASPMPTRLELADPVRQTRTFTTPEFTRQHQVELTGLRRDTEYRFRLHAPLAGEQPHFSKRYLLDTSFYYEVEPAPPGPTPLDPARAHAREILDRTGIREGWCVVLGAVDGSLAIELARQSSLKLLVVESNESVAHQVRQRLDEAGLYGVRASVHRSDAKSLPHGTFLANLIVSEHSRETGLPPAWSAAEVDRLLRPSGGAVWLQSSSASSTAHRRPDPAAWKQWAQGTAFASSLKEDAGGIRLHYRKPRLTGAGDWSHQYGAPNNASASLDEHVQGELEVAWWGDPGPRPMPDRGPRNPAPLSVNGRLYIQGDRILFGLDAYNGSILWTTIAPEVRRTNMPRDCSNSAADDQTLYLAHQRYCIAIDGQTGVRRTRFEVPETELNANSEWGYLAVSDGLLLGSRIKKESRYQGDDGEWYEDYQPDQISRVVSNMLFALDPGTGDTRWRYQNGAILNSTLTIGDGMIFFIESRNPAALQAATGRIAPGLLTDLRLVALDLKTGKPLWEKPHDFSKLQFMTYLSYSANTLVATGTDSEKHFHTYAFTAPVQGTADGSPIVLGGEMIWSESHKEDKGHHSGHLQHPVIVDGVYYSDQRSFDLKTGKTLRTDLPERRGCGTMSASKNALFFRHYFHGMWDLASDKRIQFEGIRGGCWLGLIPAGGMLLAPESSAGCSCTHAIQTTVGYVPKTLSRRNPKP